MTVLRVSLHLNLPTGLASLRQIFVDLREHRDLLATTAPTALMVLAGPLAHTTTLLVLLPSSQRMVLALLLPTLEEPMVPKDLLVQLVLRAVRATPETLDLLVLKATMARELSPAVRLVRSWLRSTTQTSTLIGSIPPQVAVAAVLQASMS